jgi:hypothetical protein
MFEVKVEIFLKGRSKLHEEASEESAWTLG